MFDEAPLDDADADADDDDDDETVDAADDEAFSDELSERPRLLDEHRLELSDDVDAANR
jgi:hypothetical protein